MLLRLCFPALDTRPYRAAPPAPSPATLWQRGARPLADGKDQRIDVVGGLGPVTGWTPPHELARCRVPNAVRLLSGYGSGIFPVPAADREIAVAADADGHVLVTIDQQLLRPPERDIGTLVDAALAAFAEVDDPLQPAGAETGLLGEAGDLLADLYGRESARTALPGAAYARGWVCAGRPFAILRSWKGEGLSSRGVEIGGFVPHPAFDGRVHFLPTVTDAAVPVWWLEIDRDAEHWRRLVDPLQDFLAIYEELAVGEALPANGWFGGPHAQTRFRERLERRRGRLLRNSGGAFDRRSTLKLLIDYERTVFSGVRDAGFADRLARQSRGTGQTAIYIVQEGGTVNNINVTGDQNVVAMGDIINNTITQTKTALAKLPEGNDLRTKLEELRGHVVEAAKALPEAEGKELLEDFTGFTQQALRQAPKAEIVKPQGQSIIETVKKVASVAAPVASLVAAVLKIIGLG